MNMVIKRNINSYLMNNIMEMYLQTREWTLGLFTLKWNLDKHSECNPYIFYKRAPWCLLNINQASNITGRADIALCTSTLSVHLLLFCTKVEGCHQVLLYLKSLFNKIMQLCVCVCEQIEIIAKRMKQKP